MVRSLWLPGRGPVLMNIALSILSSQSRFAGPDDGVGAVGYLQLGEDVGDVVAYGLGAQVEACGDLGVGVALGDEIEDLYLPDAELGVDVLGGSRFGFGEEVHEASGDLRSEVGFPGCDGAHHLEDLGRRRSL